METIYQALPQSELIDILDTFLESAYPHIYITTDKNTEQIVGITLSGIRVIPWGCPSKSSTKEEPFKWDILKFMDHNTGRYKDLSSVYESREISREELRTMLVDQLE